MTKQQSDVKIADCWVTWKDVGFGVRAIFVFSPTVPYPVGTVYVMLLGKGQGNKVRAEILDSFVTKWARRQGVRTLVNKTLFETFGVDVIVTQFGSKNGGEAFLRASGYQMEPNTGVWFLDKPSG